MSLRGNSAQPQGINRREFLDHGARDMWWRRGWVENCQVGEGCAIEVIPDDGSMLLASILIRIHVPLMASRHPEPRTSAWSGACTVSVVSGLM